MITLYQYFGDKEHSPEQEQSASGLLCAVHSLLDLARTEAAYDDWINPNTGSQISGAKGGAGDGGFRLPMSATGATNSQHKNAHAVDVYDPHNILDNWLSDSILEEFNLYREAGASTNSWCHLQDIPPHSGHRTFFP